MSSEPKKPLASQALIDHLNVVYPLKPLSLEDTDRTIWFKAGQRSVVDKLIADVRAEHDEE